MNWLKNFKCKTVIYKIRVNSDDVLVVELVQAKRVNRLRRQLLFNAAVKRSLSVDYALEYFLANRSELPKYLYMT
jgi:hypothetical protein